MSSQVNPTRVDTALDELRAAFADVTFAAGYGIGDTSDDEALLAEAVEVATAAETVVMLIGLPGADESEGFDRTHMNLPVNQITDAPSIAAPITAGSSLHEWMADPHALALIREAVAAGQPDPTRDAALVAVIGTMPMSTLAGFPGMSIDHDTLDKLAERWRDRSGQRG